MGNSPLVLVGWMVAAMMVIGSSPDLGMVIVGSRVAWDWPAHRGLFDDAENLESHL